MGRPLSQRWPLGIVLVLGGMSGIGLDRVMLAQSNGITRTELIRTNAPGGATHEAVMAIAEIAPGAGSRRHFHNGVEVGYVLEGTLAVERPDGSVVTYTPGEAFKNPEREVHNAKSAGTTAVKILAVYIVEKGKPLAQPAP